MPTTVVESLVEALPYVRRWAGRTVVVKYGGAAMTTPELAAAVTEDVVLLHMVGVKVVLVHGGGPAVSAMGERLGLKTTFVDGLRITDEETMRVAQMVHVGSIARDIVADIGRRGGRALGLSGMDLGGWLRATPRKHRARESGEEVDLGRVGDVASVDGALLRSLLDDKLIPVISPIAVDDELRALNVNADTVATAVATAVGAARLVFLTDVDGIRGPSGEVETRISEGTLKGWIDDGTVAGGMIPKAEACLSALEGGVERVTVADGRVPHALLVELLTASGVGSMIAR